MKPDNEVGGPRTDLYDLRRIRQFLAVADHLNMTHAAQELRLTQQAVSGSMRSLERDLGVRLINRVGRRLALAPAGVILKNGAAPLLHAVDALTRDVLTGPDVGETRLIIGYLPSVTPDEVYSLTGPVREFATPVTVIGRQILADEIEASLRSGDIDVALRHGASESHHLETAVIGHSPWRVALSSRHRLAHRPVITLVDLSEDLLVLPDASGAGSHNDLLVGVCRSAGFEPRVVHETIGGLVPTTSVVDDDQFTLVTAEPGLHHNDRVFVAELHGTPMAPIQALWLRHTHSPPRDALIAREG
ncbi:LysR family transcriptional regulator [Rhodococcus zopfii]|uniref:LysR family transcriptional regulator n=1 Tax=Rhodococcus zopfii TaxID=43772 RepID=UPI000933D5CC|nr:LysR family transcriptional regulator [Rhodococcus zopfii]